MRRLPIFALVLVACQNAAATELELPEFEAIDVPAMVGSAQPHLAGSDNGIVLSWTERADSSHALRFATYDGTSWSSPRTVAQGRHWFVNWADFPSILALDDGALVAHWLQRSGPGTYAYDVMIAHSADGGATWTDGFQPHRDGTQTEHGFVSLFPLGSLVGAVWLDGRKFAAAEHGAAAHSGHGDATREMTVRFASFDAQGNIAQEAVLDERACDCCQTAVALTSQGPIVAYRDRSAEEVRDISVTRFIDGAWTPPRTLHADNWTIPGCPVNGPQADAAGAAVVIAWFAAPADSPRVQLVFSSDAGASFSPPIRVDDGNAMGRVDVILLDDERALVVWLERVGAGAEVRGRLVSRNGDMGTARVFASVTAQRASGFPRMARRGDQVLLAWNEPGDSARVRAARLTLR